MLPPPPFLAMSPNNRGLVPVSTSRIPASADARTSASPSCARSAKKSHACSAVCAATPPAAPEAAAPERPGSAPKGVGAACGAATFGSTRASAARTCGRMTRGDCVDRGLVLLRSQGSHCPCAFEEVCPDGATAHVPLKRLVLTEPWSLLCPSAVPRSSGDKLLEGHGPKSKSAGPFGQMLAPNCRA
eukprot:209456-Chlamydomonas_euryale.AAC.2